MVPGFSTEQQTYGDAVGDDARYERLKEYLTICTRFWWETAAVNFKGRHYQIEDGRLKTGFCAPDRRAPEIYIAGESADARAAAAEFANCWLHSADTPENVAKDAKAVRATGIEVGLQLSCVIRPTRREAVKAARKFLGATCIAIVGTPEEVADEIQNFREAGISQFILHGWPKWEEMHIFCREVLPLVRKREQTAAGLSLRQDDLVSAWTGTNNGLGLETRI
jgi:alkanesulfonate monooxygenase